MPGGSPDRISLFTLGALFLSTGASMVAGLEEARLLAFALGAGSFLAGAGLASVDAAGALSAAGFASDLASPAVVPLSALAFSA